MLVLAALDVVIFSINARKTTIKFVFRSFLLDGPLKCNAMIRERRGSVHFSTLDVFSAEDLCASSLIFFLSGI